MRRVVSVVAVLLLASAALAGQQIADLTSNEAAVKQVYSLRSEGQFDRQDYAEEMQLLQRWLASEQVTKGLETPISITVTEEELLLLEAQDMEGLHEYPGRLRVGLVKPVTAVIDFADLQHGALQWTRPGGAVWSLAVQSKGATALRVHFDSFWLPDKAELYIYNHRGEAYGPYTRDGLFGDGEFWSHTIGGDTAVLQMHYTGSPEDLDLASFEISEIGHLGPDFQVLLDSETRFEKGWCGSDAPCIVNAECGGTSSAVNDAKYAVAYMEWVSGAWIYMCSGGLLNNTANDQTPYFLTANHCLSRGKDAKALHAYFRYWAPCGGCTSPNPTMQTVGSSVVSTNRAGDYTLLLLSETPPGGSVFMGWSTEEVASANGKDLYRISHPSGAPQAYSKHQVDTGSVVCSSWPRGGWIYSTDVVGATEGGSSGSPVVNGSGQVVGQLSGGCGYNLNDPCDNENNWTVDGAFKSYYPAVEQWLDPAGCEPDADGDSYCPPDDCNDANPDINPGAAELCDGIDNNCDGTIDEGCGTCKPKGDPCTLGSECCSGRCHPNKNTCQ